MATTTNYGWVTPDDTALVKDGASAIRTLGTSVDTTTKNLNPSTTLGDIEYRSSTANTNTRLGIGTTGQILTVAAGVPSWATSSGGQSDWILLNSGGTALTGAATITVSGISGANKVMVYMTGASSASASASFYLRLNTDTANNYISSGVQTLAGATYSVTYPRIIDLDQYGFDMGKNPLAANTSSGVAIITGCNKTGVKVATITSGCLSGTDRTGYAIQGFWENSATVTSVSLFSDTGNFDAGTVYVYTTA
jgi:hypothetical protein